MSLSVIILTKNEAANIADCLESVAWADECIVYDSGSSDATVEIAKEKGAKVFVDPDWQGFGIQRQKAQLQATGDWVLMIDADERVSEKLKKSVEEFIAAHPEENAVGKILRRNRAFGKCVRFGGWGGDCVLRLFPRRKIKFSDQKVHESLSVPAGMKIEKLSGVLDHETYRTLEQYFEKMGKYTTLWAEQRAEKKRKCGSELMCFVRGGFMFLKKYVLALGCFDGIVGLKLAWLSSVYTTTKYLKFLERCRGNGKNGHS